MTEYKFHWLSFRETFIRWCFIATLLHTHNVNRIIDTYHIEWTFSMCSVDCTPLLCVYIYNSVKWFLCVLHGYSRVGMSVEYIYMNKVSPSPSPSSSSSPSSVFVALTEFPHTREKCTICFRMWMWSMCVFLFHIDVIQYFFYWHLFLKKKIHIYKYVFIGFPS